MPILNTRGDWLKIAIRGILRQTYPNLDLILCDNGSTNATTLRIEDMTYDDNDNVSVVYAQERGTAYALDEGLKEADQDTAFFNVAGSDDLFSSSWIASRVEGFKDLPPQIAIVYEDYLLFSSFAFDFRTWGPVHDGNGDIIMRPQTIPIPLPLYDYRGLLNSNFIPGVAMYRADVYTKIAKSFVFDGYENVGRHAEDYAHWLAITDHWDAYHLDTDPALSWTYRVNLKSKYFGDRGNVDKARELLKRRAWVRRGL